MTLEELEASYVPPTPQSERRPIGYLPPASEPKLGLIMVVDDNGNASYMRLLPNGRMVPEEYVVP